ncbi:MAG: alpha/beta hydrolase [Campylobacterota bacterium]|nr:alpha/beta hydrolase [Campylobacterota bacterium]
MKKIITLAVIYLALFIGILEAKEKKMSAQQYLQSDEVIEHKYAANHVRIYGQDSSRGRFITIIPSLGRGVEDYTEEFDSTITTRLAEAGYRVILIQPRGIGKSRGDLTPANASMSMFAQDIKAVLDIKSIKSAVLIGHAFGNRLARTFATLYPSYVDDLVLMASGGNFEMDNQQKSCLRGSIDPKLEKKARLEAIDCAFFAKGNDPTVWLDGWYVDLAQAEILASVMINGDFFKKAGGKHFLLLQAAEDFIAPPDKSGKVLKAELGDQVTYVEIANAGHALSSEQPDLISKHIIKYLSRR